MSTSEDQATAAEPMQRAVPDASTRAKWRATGLGFTDLRAALVARLERGDESDPEWAYHVTKTIQTLRRGLSRIDFMEKVSAALDVPLHYWTTKDEDEIKRMALGATAPKD